MRVSLNATDGTAVIDGTGGTIDPAAMLEQNVRAVQWKEDKGEIEYVDHVKPNETITDLAPFQPVIDSFVATPPLAEPETPPEPPPPLPPLTATKIAPIEQLLLDHENRLRKIEGEPPQSEKAFLKELHAANDAYIADVAAQIAKLRPK